MKKNKKDPYMRTSVAVNQPKTQFKDYPDVLTVQQTAELLSVCKNTIYKLIRENDLPCRRIGSAIRIRKNDVLDYMRQ